MILLAAFLVFVGTAWAQPTISALACSPSSPSSVKCTWTTNAAADSQVCLSDDSICTPVLDPFAVGTGWGVTAHGGSYGIALTGLANNSAPTGYTIHVKSCNVGGCTTSGTVQTGTTSTVTSTAIQLTPIGPLIRPSDQYDGRNGYPTSCHVLDGDTQFGTWASNNHTYGICEDCWGTFCGGGGTGYLSSLHVLDRGLPNTIQQTELFTSGNNPYLSGASPGASGWGTFSMISVRGNLYMPVNSRGYQTLSVTSCSWAAGTATCNVTNTINSGQFVKISGVTPSGYNTTSTTLSAASGSSVSYPVTSDPGGAGGSGTLSYYAGSFIVKSPDFWATQITPDHNTGPAATGTLGQMPAAGHICEDLPGCVPGAVWYLNCDGMDYACTPYAGMDGWVYFYYTFRDTRARCNGSVVCLGRTPIEMMPLQNHSYDQYYKGTQTTDDGLYAAAWTTNVYDLSIHELTDSVPNSLGPYAFGWQTAIFQAFSWSFVKDFNRFVLLAPIPNGNNTSFGAGVAVWDLQYPWSKPSGAPIGAITGDPVLYPYSVQQGFGQYMPETYQLIPAATLKSIVKIRMSGGGGMQGVIGTQPNPLVDNYTDYHQRFLITPGPAATPTTTLVGSAVDYPFDVNGWDWQIYDRSGNSHTLTQTSQSGSTILYHTYLGLGTMGWPISANISNPVYVVQNNTSYALPFTAALTAFTMYACFGHVPAAPTNPVVSGEIAVNRTGDLVIARHGTTSTWDVTVKGTLIGAVPMPEGRVGCLAVRRDGSNVVGIFSSRGLVSGTATPVATATVTVSFGSGNTVIGDNTNALHGAWSRLAFYSSSRTDSQMAADMDIIRKDMQKRRTTIQ